MSHSPGYFDELTIIVLGGGEDEGGEKPGEGRAEGGDETRVVAPQE